MHLYKKNIEMNLLGLQA